MTDQFDCLICGRPALANGEPGCDCVTHSLSRPVHPPDWEPDPADVARFPLEPTPAPSTRVRSVLPATPTPIPTSDPAPADAFPHHLPDQVGPRRSAHSHRKPRQRTRMAAAAGGAVAAVVGCTALAASFFGGQGRVNEVRGGPSLSVPDNNPPADDLPDEDRTGESGPGGAGSDEPSAGASRAPEPEGGGAENGGYLDTPPLPDPPQPTQPSPTTPPVQQTPDPDPTTPGPDPTTPAEPSDPGTDEPPTEEPSEPPTQEPTDEPSNPGGEDPAPVLQLGDEGPEVVELQKRLLQLNWVYAGEAHGVYDEATRDAVERFQNAYGIEDDPPGVYGAVTRKTLEANTNEP